MKKVIFIFLLCLSSMTLYSQLKEFEWQNPKPTGNNFFDVKMLNSENIMLFGTASTVLRSTNSGDSWTVSYVDTLKRSIEKAYFINQNIGFFCGEGGLIMKTTNGGINWAYKNSGILDKLSDIAFFDQDTGYAVGASGTILKTVNGGDTWAISNYGTVSLNCIFIVDASTIYLGSSSASTGRLIRSTDYGTTWTNITPGILTQTVWGIFFINPSTGWLATAGSLILKTTDSGTTWTSSTTGSGTNNRVLFLDLLVGYAVNSNGQVLSTTDGGTNWTISTISTQNLRSIANPISTSNPPIFVCGNAGSVFGSIDGINWSPKFSFVTQQILRRNHFIDKNTGFASGGSSTEGLMLKTTNGGNTWSKLLFEFTNQVYCFSMPTENIWYTGTGNNKIFKTTDGGNNFVQQTTPITGTTHVYWDMEFVDADTGYASGASGKMIKTTNGGSTWFELSPGFGTNVIYDIAVLDANTIIAVGLGANARKTTDGGITWTPLSHGISGGFFVTEFYNSNIGLIGGGSLGLTKTTDGGISWTPMTLPSNMVSTSSIWSIGFIDTSFFLIGTINGEIAYTKDGGTTWIYNPSKDKITTNTLFDISVVGNDFWYSGSNGTILKGGTLLNSISGMKFNDLNGDGIKDVGEPGLAGWQINLYGPKSDTVQTGSDGYYFFDNLPDGEYIITEDQKGGWVQTKPAPPGSYTMNLAGGQDLIDIDFGNFQVPPAINNIGRSIKVPLGGEPVTVTATIVDSTGIDVARLLWTINGTTTDSVAMVRTSGTMQNGIYSGVIPGSANSDGNRIEYQIKAVSLSTLFTTTPISAANSYFAGLSPLLLTGVRAIDTNRQILYSGYYCRVTGTVNSPNFTVGAGRISYMFQDAVGGMNVNKPSTLIPALALGDSIIVVGALGQFRGTTQLTPDNAATDITIVATGRPLSVIDVSVSTYNSNPEFYESRLIRMSGLQRLRATPLWGSNVSIPVFQGVVGDSTIMFIDGDTDLQNTPEPTYPVTVTGVATQYTSATTVYNNGYQIAPRYTTDFSWDTEFEPNNTSATANYLVLGSAVSAALSPAGDVDWFKFVGPIGHLVVDATDPGNTTDVDLYLYDSTGINLLYNIDRNTNDRLEYNLAYSGIYYINVKGYQNATGPYTLFARIAPGTDPLEPDDGPLFGFPLIATAVGPYHRDSTATIDPGVGLPGFDIDYRYIGLTVGQQVTATLKTKSKFATTTLNGGYLGIGRKGLPVSLTPQAFGGTPLASGVSTTGTDVTVVYNIAVTDTYYVFVSVHLQSPTYGMDQAGPNANYLIIIDRTVGVENEPEIPVEFALYQNYPNPFNPTTNIKFALPEVSKVVIEIYNVLGQKVRTLISEERAAGYHVIEWNGQNKYDQFAGSGVYYVRISADGNSGKNFKQVRKIIMIK